MFKKIGLENIVKSKVATGVEIVLLPDGAFEINLVILKREKSNVLIEKKEIEIKDIASLSKIADAKNPIVLVINGKGIIHRKIAFSENDSDASLLNKVLPNANLSEFYIQKQDFSSTQTYLSVVRASAIDDVLNVLKGNNITNIVACFIGPFVINKVLPLINKDIISNEYLSVGSFKLLIREDEIQDVLFLETAAASTVKVGDDLLEGKLLVPFAAALSYFVGAEEEGINSEKVELLKENFNQKQKFHVFGWSLLVASFLILIVNYFVFNQYWEKSNELNATLALNQSALKKYESLKLEYAQKKTFLEQNGLMETSRTSYFADQLAASVPLSIQLLQMDIHPMKKKEVNDLTNALYFDTKTIKISGKCDRNTELNDWMNEIKKNAWIENVSLLNYKQDNAKDDGVFFIEIKLK